MEENLTNPVRDLKANSTAFLLLVVLKVGTREEHWGIVNEMDRVRISHHSHFSI
jgi:hypothetical protein